MSVTVNSIILNDQATLLEYNTLGSQFGAEFILKRGIKEETDHKGSWRIKLGKSANVYYWVQQV